MSRRDARTAAVKIVFQYSFSKNESSPTDIDRLISDYMETFDDSDGGAADEYIYMCDVVRGTVSHIEEIDSLISKCSESWTLDRIVKTDLSILRVAVYEMIYRDDIPESISINEAVELAKVYGDSNSPSFVNGVLGGIFKICKQKD